MEEHDNSRNRDRDEPIKYDHFKMMEHMDMILRSAEDNGNELQEKPTEFPPNNDEDEEIDESGDSSDFIEESCDSSSSDDDEEEEEEEEEINGDSLLQKNMKKVQSNMIKCIKDFDDVGLTTLIENEISFYKEGKYNDCLGSGQQFYPLLGINGPVFNFALESGCTQATEVLIDYCEKFSLPYNDLKFSSFMEGMHHVSNQLTKENQKVARSFVKNNVRDFFDCNFGLFLELSSRDIGPCIDELIVTTTDFFFDNWTPCLMKKTE